MYCPKCGSENNDDAAFCGSCGAKINTVQAKTTRSNTVTKSFAGYTKVIPVKSVSNTSGLAAIPIKRTNKRLGIVAAFLIMVLIIVTFGTNGFGLLGSNIKYPVKDSVSAYSWEELSKISAEIGSASDKADAIRIAKAYNLTNSDGKLDGNQTKSFTTADGKEITVQICGFTHDEKADGSGKAGITFIYQRAFTELPMGSKYDRVDGGWAGSSLRSRLNDSIYGQLPDDLRAQIKKVNKQSRKVADNEQTVVTTEDNLWLFSMTELAGNAEDGSYESDGEIYQLFSDLGTPEDNYSILVKGYPGSRWGWWERTSLWDGFYVVTSGGNPKGSGVITDSYGVVPGFCI